MINLKNIAKSITEPVKVMAWLAGLFAPPGLPVLDPFCGTGATLRACKDLRLPAVGIEQEERYCEMTVRRLSQEILAFDDPKEPA